MFVIYGKGEVGTGLQNLLSYLEIPCKIMDDKDIQYQDLQNADKIIPSPGIKPSHYIYKEFLSKIISEMDLVYDILQQKGILENFRFIGITGTKGKSTTSWIVYNLLKDFDSNTYIGGNFSPSFAQIIYEILHSKTIKNQKINVVIEISSFMLYNTNRFQLENSIFTNIEKDHLDWHTDYQDYLNTKQKIFQLTQNKVFVGDDFNTAGFSNSVKSSKIGQFETKLLGQHNQTNISLAFNLVKEHSSQKDKEIINNIPKIKPLANTLEYVKSINGVKFFNDGKSTTPGALKSALKSFDSKIILIAGGYDKGADFNELRRLFSEKVHFASLIGTTAPVIGNILNELGIGCQIFENLPDAVHNSYKKAINDNIQVVLFSPGCASLDMFDNYKHRVQIFLESVGGIG